MVKTFLRVFYITFLWIILMMNLFIFFDLVNAIPLNFVQTIGAADYENSYFGVSSLINALKNLDKMPISYVTQHLGYFINFLKKSIDTIIEKGEIPTFDGFSTNIGVNIIYVLQQIANMFIKVGTFFASVVLYSFSLIVYVIYFLSMVINLFFTIMMFFSGQYLTPLPPSIL